MDVDGLLLVEVALGRLDGRQLEIRTQDVLSTVGRGVLVASELLDSPLESIVLGNVDSTAGRGVEGGTLDILRHRHVDINVISNALLLVVALNLNDEADAGVGGRLHDHVHRKQRLHADVQTVAHELELTVRRDEGHQTLVLETTQPHALVELDIVELHSLVLGGTALGLVVGLVVEAQLEVGHSGELAICVNHSDDFALDDVVGGPDEHG